MSNLRWLNQDELKGKLTQVNKTTQLTKSGIPMTYDQQNLYIDNTEVHSIVIGTTGSGKTQSVLLPQARLAIRANESIIVNDVKGEIYEKLKDDLEANNYNTIILNLENPTEGNHYNPLKVAYDLYQTGNKDKAMELLENVAYYLFSNPQTNNSDPFWENSAINYFTGLALYLFEKKDETNITLNGIFNLSTEINKSKESLEKILAEVSTNPGIYMNLVGILQAPTETRGSIIAVFVQKIKLFISREGLSNMLSKTDFDITTAINETTAIFIISGTAVQAKRLIPLLINQFYYVIDIYGTKSKRINMILDEFGKINAIKDVVSVINNSRSIGIRLTIFIMSLLELKNIYGVEKTELIKISFGNIIYLLANDIETLEEISDLCGKENNQPLITPEELKLLETFEAVILIPRVLPIKTKLIPDYKIEW